MHAGHTVLLQSGAVEWTKSGYNGGIISLFFSIGVIAEIILFYFGTQLERKFTTIGFFMLAAVASAIRWAGMALNPDFFGILLFQSLHGFTFGALHLGCVRYFKENLPDGTLGAAQLIYGAVMWGFVMIPAAIIGGYLYEIYSLQAYWAMVILVIIGLVIMLCANNKYHHRFKIMK
jgi:PPP family 3-phenylpropionic acid transporter